MEVRFTLSLSLLWILLSKSCFGEDAFNRMIDRAMVKLENDLTNGSFREVVYLPESELYFKKNLLRMEFDGQFELRGGRLVSISGTRKVGQATLQQSNNGDTRISLNLSWDQLVLSYDFCHLNYLFIDMFDSLSLTVGRSLVSLNATFHYGMGDNCSVKMDSAEVLDLGDFTSQYGPQKWYEFINDRIINWAIQDQSTSIIQTINTSLLEKIKGVVAKMNLCKYLPY